MRRITCPKCGYTNKLTKEQRAERIGRGLRAAVKRGERVGRKRKSDYQQIEKLRDEGKSLSTIAAILGVSKGSVAYALRK